METRWRTVSVDKMEDIDQDLTMTRGNHKLQIEQVVLNDPDFILFSGLGGRK